MTVPSKRKNRVGEIVAYHEAAHTKDLRLNGADVASLETLFGVKGRPAVERRWKALDREVQSIIREAHRIIRRLDRTERLYHRMHPTTTPPWGKLVLCQEDNGERGPSAP